MALETIIYHAGALGDFITILPALKLWKMHNPRNRTVFLGRRAHGELGIQNGYFNEIWDMDGRDHISLFSSELSRKDQMRLSVFSSAILFTDPVSPLAHHCRKAGIPLVSVQEPFPKDRVSKYQYHLSLFPQWLIDETEMMPLLIPPRRGESEQIPWFKSTAPRVAIHPGSGSPLKNWPIENFLELSDRLTNMGCAVIWLCGPAEDHLRLPERISCIRNRALPFLLDVLSMSDLYIGNDSGISHCAAALDRCCIILFGASDPEVWRPAGTRIRTVTSSCSSGPCHGMSQTNHRGSSTCLHDCMRSIPPDTVFAASRDLLMPK